MKALLAVLALVLIGSEAMAGPSPSAQKAFESGLTRMAAHDYERACEAFAVSLRLDPQYGTLLNLAICYVRLGKLYAGWKLYGDVARGDPDRQRARKAARAAEELWPRLAKLRVRGGDSDTGTQNHAQTGARQIANLRIRIDDIDVTSMLDTDVPVDDGEHRIDAELPGKQPFHQDVSLAAGEMRTIELAFEDEAATAPETAAPTEPVRMRTPQQAPPSAPPPAPPAPSSASSAWPWIMIGSGGALVAGGLVAGWRAHSLDDEAHAACQLGRCNDPAGSRRLIDRAQVWANVATVTVLVGAVAIGGGIYLWRSERDSVRVDLVAAPGAGSLVVRGAF